MLRRGFLTGVLALGAAPAIVRASSLMRVAAPAGMPPMVWSARPGGVWIPASAYYAGEVDWGALGKQFAGLRLYVDHRNEAWNLGWVTAPADAQIVKRILA